MSPHTDADNRNLGDIFVTINTPGPNFLINLF